MTLSKILFAALAVVVLTAGTQVKAFPAYLLGLDSKGDKITIGVVSQGCTNRDNFKFHLRREAGQTRLTVLRKQGRHCLVTPHAIRLTYSRKEIGLKPGEAFIVTNPMGPMPKTAHRMR